MLYLVPVVILSFMHITCTNTLFHICQACRDSSFYFLLVLKLSVVLEELIVRVLRCLEVWFPQFHKRLNNSSSSSWLMGGEHLKTCHPPVQFLFPQEGVGATVVTEPNDRAPACCK